MGTWLLLLVFPLLILSVLFLSLSVNGLERKIRLLQEALEKRFPDRTLVDKSKSDSRPDSK